MGGGKRAAPALGAVRLDQGTGLRRPLLWFSAVFLVSLALFLGGGGLFGLLVAGTALLLCVIIARRPAVQRQLLLAGGLACLLAFGMAWGQRQRLARWQSLSGELVAFTGWLREDDPYTPGRGRVEGSVLLEGIPCRVTLDLRGLGEEFAPGSWLTGSLLVLEARQEGDAPGGVTLHGAVQGDPLAMAAPGGFHPLARLVSARWELSQRAWRRAPGEDTGVVLSMVFSRQELLSRPLLEQMSRAGLRHLLVVSGLHLSMASGWVLAACRWLGLGKRASSLAAIPAVWLLAGLAGFSTPVLRAGAMLTLWLAGRCLGHRGDSVTSLALAGLLLALLSPPVVFQAGWQLTFSATLGVVLGAGPLGRRLTAWWKGRFGRAGRLARWLLDSLSVSACAQLATLPVLAGVFGSFSVWGIGTTLLAVPLASGVILLGGLGCALLPLARTAAAGGTLLDGARWLARRVLDLAALAGRLPGGAVPVRLPYQLAFCFLAPAAALGYLLLRPRLSPREGRRLRRGMAAAMALAILYTAAYYRGAVMVSAGETGAVVVTGPEGTLVLAAGESGYQQRALSAQLLRSGAGGPLVLVCPGEVSLNGVLWWRQALSPDLCLVPEGELDLLRDQQQGAFLPLGQQPVEPLPGLRVSFPSPRTALVEVSGRKVLKSWSTYGIIADMSQLPPGLDLLVDREGRVYPLAPDLRPGRMPTGDSNLMLPPGKDKGGAGG